MTRTYQLPASRVVLIGDAIVKLNTQNGALQLFRGTAGPTGSGDEWVLRVPPVKGKTSGMLDLQDVHPGTFSGVFLVDVSDDRSWILKWRGNENGEWLEVKER